jgi:hypothetical protein
MSLLITTFVVSAVIFWGRRMLIAGPEDEDSRPTKTRSLIRFLGRAHFGEPNRNGNVPILQVSANQIFKHLIR